MPGQIAGSPIEHVVAIIQENSTHDRHFGQMRRGIYDATIRRDTDPPDVPYAWDPTHAHWWSSKYHKWNDYHGALTREQIPFYWNWAENFGLADTFHGQVFTSSTFNGHWQLMGFDTQDPADPKAWVENPPSNWFFRKAGQLLRGDPKTPMPLHGPTLPKMLEDHGLTWRNYGDGVLQKSSEVGKSPNNRPVTEFANDARAGRLPTFSYVHPPFDLTEHPPESVGAGEEWVRQQVAAVMSGPNADSTAILVMADDAGGNYDHAPTPELPLPPDADAADMAGLSPRLWMVVLSKWSRKGYLSSERGGVLTFLSVVKFVRENFGLPEPPLAKAAFREAQVDSLWDFFDFSHMRTDAPITERSQLPPTPTPIRPTLTAAQKVKESFLVPFHDYARKGQANVRLLAIALLWVTDRPMLSFAKPVTAVFRRVLGLENPTVSRYAHCGWPGTKPGAFLLGAVGAFPLWTIPMMGIDVVARWLIANGMYALPSTEQALTQEKVTTRAKVQTRRLPVKNRVASAVVRRTGFPAPALINQRKDLHNVITANAKAGVKPTSHVANPTFAARTRVLKVSSLIAAPPPNIHPAVSQLAA